MVKSHLTGKAIVVTWPGTEEQALIVDVEIDCPSCGAIEFRIAGHHLRALRNLLVEMIDLHPALVGEEAGLEVIKRMTYSGTPPAVPEDN